MFVINYCKSHKFIILLISIINIMNSTTTISDDNNTNLHLFVLEPLSVIIKLTIY